MRLIPFSKPDIQNVDLKRVIKTKNLVNVEFDYLARFSLKEIK